MTGQDVQFRLSVTDLSMKFGGVVALKDVSFSVEPGQRLSRFPICLKVKQIKQLQKLRFSSEALFVTDVRQNCRDEVGIH